ncbi:MAG: LamG domain-containing protein [Fimbriimonadaceae bacterium]|nr:LamG domain-containing protein [Fimbriimonadaceae bacterium]QYK59009.1 MAG: LamG domain-containing protein [Fimbriimonadaceae bacterium]
MFSAVCLLAVSSITDPLPVAWILHDGSNRDTVTGLEGRVVGDAKAGIGGATFFGKNGGFVFPDCPAYALGRSFTVTAEVRPFAWPSGGTSPAGQIVFRGDDRSGHDNYSLNLGNDGYFSFVVYGSTNEFEATGVRSAARLGEWQRLVGAYDARAREMRLYIDGVTVGQTAVPFRPITLMESGWNPGLSVGNVQNPLGGVHNQPFHGEIRDVRLYAEALLPDVAARPLPTAKD